jgi:hypothetical protein
MHRRSFLLGIGVLLASTALSRAPAAPSRIRTSFTPCTNPPVWTRGNLSVWAWGDSYSFNIVEKPRTKIVPRNPHKVIPPGDASAIRAVAKTWKESQVA